MHRITKNLKAPSRAGFLILFSLCGWMPWAGWAAPYGIEGEATSFRQPDGSDIKLRVFGDEFYAVTETDDGYVVVFDSGARAYFYGELIASGEEIVSSGVMVRGGQDAQKLGFTKHIRITPGSRQGKAAKRFEAYDRVVRQTEAWEQKKADTRDFRRLQALLASSPAASSLSGDGPITYAPPETTGNKVGITILVDFPDVAASIPVPEIDDFFNQPGYAGYGNKGSVFNYFYTQSVRKLRYNNVITYYVRMQQPKSYYNDTSLDSGVCGRRLLEDALALLTAAGFDFSACTVNGSSNIEACNLLFAGADSGVWAKGLWPHRWSLASAYNVGGGKRVYDYQMTDIGSSLTIGTVCHENGHMLCKYPDFYDYDGDSSGCGKYTLMASGNHYYQTSPISVGAYLRYHSGWVEAVTLNPSVTERCSVRVDEGRIYLFDNPDAAWPGEYFLIENRAKVGWEATSGLPDQGLLIMHCDENGDRDAQEMTEALHYECSIEQADNAFDLENDRDSGDAYDLFHSGGVGPNMAFTDNTSPNAHWWKGATTSTTSGNHSGLLLQSISASGRTMTFISGTGTLSSTPEIGVDVSVLATETDYGTDASPVSFAVWNRQGGTLSYTLSTNASWMRLSTVGGTATTESDVVDLSFQSAGLSPGLYSGTITITDPGAANNPQTIGVALEVLAPPHISANSNAFTFSGFSGATGITQVLKLANTGGGSMAYALSWESDWLSATVTNGLVLQEVDMIDLTMDTSGLGVGVYRDTVTVTSATADNSPYAIDIEVSITGSPEIQVSPATLLVQVTEGGEGSGGFSISNAGSSDLIFSLSDDQPSGEYAWVDTLSPGGAVYDWIDISSLGSAVSLSDDGESAMLAIGFPFPFYDGVYSQFQIGANGVISFTSGNVGYSNQSLPSSEAPSQSVFVFWDDLNPSAGGTIRYHSTPERLVVSWLAVPFYGSSSLQTFQVVFYPDGRICFHYQTLNGTLTSATLGIQDDRVSGPSLEVAYNESYLKSGLAVEIRPPQEPGIVYTTTQGTVAPSATTSVWFTAFAAHLPPGNSTTLLTVACNDVDTPFLQIPIALAIVPASEDGDGDNLPDWWEVDYFGAPTQVNAATICSNGINTVWEAYVAGFDPTVPTAGFTFFGIEKDYEYFDQFIFDWPQVSGRLYNIYYSSNPISGFELLVEHFPGGIITNNPPRDDQTGFWGVEVLLAP
ncbi:MAG: M6 family metalloprotease domain-containing protein [Verrucomicrobia bacterium]|nr:M6 family metalloprotease domain-containing protein [Verrucomicrobiota bacterium]